MPIYFFIVFIGIFGRLIPHEWNFAPVTAIAIFSAVYLNKKEAIAIPLLIRFISDAVLGFFAWPLMLAVYASHLFGVLAGLWLKKKKTPVRTILAPAISALIFFLVTNFAWLYADYPHTWNGVILAYTNGLPFFRGTLMGDVFFTVSIVGTYELVKAHTKKTQILQENIF